MRAWRRARRAGIVLVCCGLLPMLTGAKGRIEARARVVDATVAQLVSERAERELDAARTTPSRPSSSILHVVEGCSFRFEWTLEKGATTQRVLQIESLGS